MIKIKYNGELLTCRVKIGSMIIHRWNKGEVKDVSKDIAEKLLKNKDFKVTDGSVFEPVEEVLEVKEEVEYSEETVFDYKTADKDELLDYTAVNGLDADYSMTVKELRKVVREYLDN